MGIPPFRELTEEGSLADLERGRIAMSLNEPALDATGECVVEGSLVVRGWAHARDGIDTVAVVLDAARDAGFALRFDSSDCPPGEHALTIVAIARNGDAVGVARRVVCRPDPLEDSRPPAAEAKVDWIEEPGAPPRAHAPLPDSVDSLRELVATWESRALTAEADAAASRIEAGLASSQQEAAIQRLRAAEARLRELEAKLAEPGGR